MGFPDKHFELDHKAERINEYVLYCAECDMELDRTPKMTDEERRQADDWDAEVIS